MMTLFARFRAVYARAPKDHSSRADSLLVAHLALMSALLLLGVIFVRNGDTAKMILAAVLLGVYGISMGLGWKGLYVASANTVSIAGFAFMATMSVLSSLTSTDPHLIFMASFYAVAPCIMSTLLCVSMAVPYALAAGTVALVTWTFFGVVLPGNPGVDVADLALRFLVFDILLLMFMAHFILKKHRITQGLLHESDHFARESEDRNRTMQTLLAEVRTGIDTGDRLAAVATRIDGGIRDAGKREEHIRMQASALSRSFQDIRTQMDSVGTGLVGMARSADAQFRAQEESVGASTQMAASIQNVDGIVERKVATARKLLQSGAEGLRNMETTTDIMKEINAKVEAVSEFTGLIDHIASQTNLLSMNAAIEAAHAGTAGKGFAVVAEEIRKLAENAAENSRSIAEVLKSMEDSTRRGTTATQLTQTVFQDLMKEIRETVAAFEEIKSSTGELGHGSTDIQSSLRDLSGLGNALQEHARTIRESQIQVLSHLDGMGKGLESVEHDLDTLGRGNRDIATSLEELADVLARLRQVQGRMAGVP